MQIPTNLTPKFDPAVRSVKRCGRTNMKPQVIDAAEELVKRVMSAYASSHDWHHLNQVCRLGCSAPLQLGSVALQLTEPFGKRQENKYLQVCDGHEIDSPAMRRFKEIMFYPFHDLPSVLSHSSHPYMRNPFSTST